MTQETDRSIPGRETGAKLRKFAARTKKCSLGLVCGFLLAGVFWLFSSHIWLAQRAVVQIQGEGEYQAHVYRQHDELFVRVSQTDLYLLDLKQGRILGVAVLSAKHYFATDQFLIVFDSPPLKTDPFKLEGDNKVHSSGKSITFRTADQRQVMIDRIL